MRHLTNYFYAGGGMVALADPVWLQGAFNTLTGLFDRVVLWKDVSKKVRMICHHCRESGTQLEAA